MARGVNLCERMVHAAAILLAAATRSAAHPRETPDFVAPPLFREQTVRQRPLPPALQARLDAVLARLDVSGNALCLKMRW